MSLRPLEGKKIAVLVESQYVPGEIEAYRYGFGALGAEVHLSVSYTHLDVYKRQVLVPQT